MNADAETAWDRWRAEFIEVTNGYEVGREFEVSDVFGLKWREEFTKPEKLAFGRAVSFATNPVRAPDYGLAHIEKIEPVIPPYHRRYRRVPHA